jgi:hypothetical protein
MRLGPSVLVVALSVGCTCGEKLPPPGAEKQAPTWPAEALLTLTDVTETSATLTWPNATRALNRLRGRTGGFFVHGGFGRGTAGCIQFNELSLEQKALGDFDAIVKD